MKDQRERRSYDQQCGLAAALDVIGERWTLLIVRELLLRPCRYRDLVDALPGIGTNLLAERLAFLTDAGIVRPLDTDRRTAGYTLTEAGERLREPVLALARFGLGLLAVQPERRSGTTRASWAVLAIEAMIDQDRAGADETYEFDIDGEVFHVVVAQRRAGTRLGPAAQPVMRVGTDTGTFFRLGSRELDPLEAVLTGAVTVHGDASAVSRCLRLIGLLPEEVRPVSTPRLVRQRPRSAARPGPGR